MTEKQELCDMIKRDFAENYIGKLFYFCLKKTSNSYEAEDLAGDIALAVFAELDRLYTLFSITALQ